MSDNPIKYSDLFDFSDNGGIRGAIRDIKKLKEAYKDFTDSVTGGQLKMLADQQKALAETVRELAAASKDLNITQKQSQQQLLDNAAAMAKLDAANKTLQQTQQAAKATNTAVKGSVDQLTAQLKAQIVQYNALGQTKQRDIAKAAQLTQSINQTRTRLNELNGAVRQNITAFNAAAGSYNELDVQTKKLMADLKNLPNAFTTNAAAAKQMQATINANIAKLKEFDRAMNVTTRNVGNYSSAFSQIGGSIQSMIGPIAIFMASLSAVRRIITTNSEISDSLADVRRTAQLTEVEASNLLETLKEFDTRTSLKGLVDIAIIAGQLGIAKNDISGFVEAIDQLAVTLSGEIPGGAEEVATALGKINGVFKTQIIEGTTINEAYNKTGSAILALGQVGLATGAYLQDFALRTAGVAQTARLSLPTILAYSAVLEETGSSAEVAGTAFNRLVGSLASKRDKFFAIAKLGDATLTLKDFTDTINTDANKALQQFFAGLNKSQNLTQFIDLLGEIKIKAGPAQNAIIALAKNQDKLNERIGQSQTAYENGTLATEQFEIKNNNLAASLEKVGNEFDKATTSAGGFADTLKFFAEGAAIAIKNTDTLYRKLARLFADFGQGFGDLLAGPEEAARRNSERVAASAADRQRSLILANRDEAIGRGTSKANIIIGNNGDQASLGRALASEKAKLDVLFKQSNYAKEFAKDTRNSTAEIQPQIEKFKRLQGVLLQQDATVKRLKSVYEALYKVQNTADADKYKDTSKADKAAQRAADAEKRRQEQAEKQARDSQNRILETSAKYQTATLELEYAKGNQSTESEIKFENDKLKVLEDSFALRLKLYDKDSEEYQKILLEKLEAEKNNTVKTLKIQKDADEKTKKDKDKLDKSISSAKTADVGLSTEKRIADLNKGKTTGNISEGDFNRQLFEIKKADIQQEIDAAQAQMDKFSEIDSEYYDAKKEKLNAEKALVKEQSDYEISEAERVAELKKQTQQAVFDFTSELGNSLFEIGATLGEARIADLEHQRDTELAVAGNNADAKAKIQEKYDKKINAQKRKQAVFDKIEALFNIGVNTAVAVTKVLAQTGILSPFVVPGIIAAGALQAAAVLAKPLPKYKHGRSGGKGEYAIVNDGYGPEVLEKNGKYRIAGKGKETVTWLDEGEKVHTAEKSAKILYDDFEVSNSSNRFVDNLIFGQGIMRAKEENTQRAIVNAIVGSKINKSDLIDAFSQSIDKMEIQQLIVDEKGHNTYLKRKNQRINDQNSRNTFGGQG